MIFIIKHEETIEAESEEEARRIYVESWQNDSYDIADPDIVFKGEREQQ